MIAPDGKVWDNRVVFLEITAPRQLHPTKEQRDAGIGFGAVEIGYNTLEKLAEHLLRMR